MRDVSHSHRQNNHMSDLPAGQMRESGLPPDWPAVQDYAPMIGRFVVAIPINDCRTQLKAGLGPIVIEVETENKRTKAKELLATQYGNWKTHNAICIGWGSSPEAIGFNTPEYGANFRRDSGCSPSQTLPRERL